MAITVNTNIPSLTAQKALSGATKAMNTAMERMSTGYKINSSKDDAAGMAVATNLAYKASSFKVAQDNAQMGQSMLDTTEGVLDVIKDNLTRVRDLTEQAANGTYGADSLAAIKSEITARLDEIDRIAANCEFNGIKMMIGGTAAQGGEAGGIKENINLQVGLYSSADSKITLDASLFRTAKVGQLFKHYSKGDNGATTDDTLDTKEEIATACTGSSAADMINKID